MNVRFVVRNILLGLMIFTMSAKGDITDEKAINILSNCLASLSKLNSFNESYAWPGNPISCSSANVAIEATEFKKSKENEFMPHPVNFIPDEGVTELLFQKDENPEKEVANLGCITGDSENIDLCYPSFLEDIRSGKLKMSDLKVRIPSRFDIKAKDGEFEDKKIFEFHHHNFARQDVGLTIWDGYHNSKNRNSKATEIVFIPREQVPRLKTVGANIEVTLANNEKLIFDKTTGKLSSGVLKEIKSGKSSSYAYTGSGIMIQTTGVDGQAKSFMETAKKAIISKDGKTCELDYEKLWIRPGEKTPAHFKFATDESFYKWLNTQSGCFK